MKLPIEVYKIRRKALVESLRSDVFTQGKNSLMTPKREDVTVENATVVDFDFCCLGVACIVAGEEPIYDSGRKEWGFKNDTSYNGIETGVLPTSVRQYYNFSTQAANYRNTKLPVDNDRNNMTFLEIADIIDSEPDGLFADA